MKKTLIILLAIVMLFSSALIVYADNGSVGLLQNLNIINGYSDGSLQLEKNVSRAEFTKMIVAATKHKNNVATSIFVSPFIDVTHKHWAAPYILVALENNLVSGYLDATFRPDNTVNYEEAISVALRCLGYTKDDYGAAWPYGQIGIAEQIGLTKGMNCVIGQPMTRGDISVLIGNMLVSKDKDNCDYVSSLGYKLAENVELVSVDSAGNVYTNNGNYTSKYRIDTGLSGSKGTLVLNQQNETLGFVSVNSSAGSTKEYVVDSVIDGKVITYISGSRHELKISDNVIAYIDNNKSTYGIIKTDIQPNDKMVIKYNENGVMQYISINSENLGIITESNLDRFVLYATLNDAVLAYNNGELKQLQLEDSLTIYMDNQKTSYSAIKNNLKMGDVLNVKYKNNVIEYVSVEDGIFTGPKTIVAQNWDETLGVDISAISIIRNGVKCSKEDVQINDIIYYSNDLKIAFAYNNTVTGVYQSASPNTDTPSTVTVSGKEFSIEGITAFNKLSSGGKYQLGDSITLLLGKEGKVADVISVGQTSTSASTLVGYVAEVGSKEFLTNGKSTKEYFVKIVTPDGSAVDYKTKTQYTSYKNGVVKVTFDDGYAKLSKISNNTTIKGTFDYENKTFSGKGISSNIQILDVYSSRSSEVSLYTNVYPQRLDMVNIPSGNVLYCEEDSKGRITKLILENVTGDMIKYGLMIKAENQSEDYYMFGRYKYDIEGVEYELETNNVLYNVSSGSPIKVILNGDEIVSMQKLTVASGKITDFTYDSVKIGNSSHAISPNVCVYLVSSSTSRIMDIGDLINNLDDYSVSMYYDKTQKSGGLIRVIVVRTK